ncbi:hypothetical protein ATH33_1738 [Thermoactinomyces vulgaris]|jgi:hypothetical protein|nr:hypothetical protein ATH33_1738 [Thermoactinomyces vulgaris]
MGYLGLSFLATGIVLELIGIFLVYRGKNQSLEPIMMGLVFLLVGMISI